MTYSLSVQSQAKLQLVHPDLKKVVEAAILVSPIEFIVTEGLRTLERQKILFASGATKTMNSRHLCGHAVDLAAIIDNRVCWKPALYTQIANAFLAESAKLNIPITWGGSWLSFPDLDHIELNVKFYPMETGQ